MVTTYLYLFKVDFFKIKPKPLSYVSSREKIGLIGILEIALSDL